jgi:hypothetical protein
MLAEPGGIGSSSKVCGCFFERPSLLRYQTVACGVCLAMPWTVLYHENFRNEFDALPDAVQDELFSLVNLLFTRGPKFGSTSQALRSSPPS